MPRARAAGRYPNRSDLRQPVKTAPSQTYGDGVASERAQRAVPLPAMPSPGGTAPGGAGAAAGPLPGSLGFDAPSARPGEPVTAGMPMGAGPGPSAVMPAVDPVVETLRAAYRAFPNESIASLLEALG